MIPFNPSAATPLLLLMGVVASVGVHQIFLGIGRRREALHPWVVAWCANTLLVLSSHYLQTTADSPEWAALGARLAWTSSLLLIVVMIGLSHALAEHPPPRPLLAGVAGADLALRSAHRSPRGPLLGARAGPVPDGPRSLPLRGVRVLRVHRLAEPLAPRERRAVLAGFAVYFVFSVNDVLHAAQVIQSVRLFDYAFVGVAVGLHYLLVTRFNRISADLEGAVAIRNASLFEAEGSARRAAEPALAEVKALRGLLPICSYCKKVRNDENYWEQIESYVSHHSHAQFSHRICPDCRDGVVKEQLDQSRRHS